MTISQIAEEEMARGGILEPFRRSLGSRREQLGMK
jgi:hypothetical protein